MVLEPEKDYSFSAKNLNFFPQTVTVSFMHEDLTKWSTNLEMHSLLIFRNGEVNEHIHNPTCTALKWLKMDSEKG